jgi:hypothetical protein
MDEKEGNLKIIPLMKAMSVENVNALPYEVPFK